MFPCHAFHSHPPLTPLLFYRLCCMRSKCRVSLFSRVQRQRHVSKQEDKIKLSLRHARMIKRGSEHTYRVEVESESRFLVLIHPWHTCAAHFRQPVPPHQRCHLWKVTSSSDSRTEIDSLLRVVRTAGATCSAVSTPLPERRLRDKLASPPLSLWLSCLQCIPLCSAELGATSQAQLTACCCLSACHSPPFATVCSFLYLQLLSSLHQSSHSLSPAFSLPSLTLLLPQKCAVMWTQTGLPLAPPLILWCQWWECSCRLGGRVC